MFAPKIFDTNIEPCCAYCVYGTFTQDKQSILCEKRGVTLPSDSCRKFKYDPLARVPGSRPDLPEYDAKDFSL